MKERWLTDKQRRWLIAGIYISSLILGFLYYLLITYTSIDMSCKYYEQTGNWCGGCGVTRMMLSLMKLDIPTAFSYNPVMFILLCVWNIVGIGAFVGKPRFFTNVWVLSILCTLTVASAIAFTIVRS